jgi:hypothetical protein
MAGAGYKLFNTGDVLTAQQVNEYLQQQTVMVFANSTARTTALSGVLAEGMMSYLQDTNAVQVYNGSAWVGVGGSSPLTTKGDLYTYSTTDARLGVGTDGQFLSADSTQATGLKWSTPTSGSMTLISTTTMSGASVTLSSIPQTYKDLRIDVRNWLPATDQALYVRFNGDTNTRYVASLNYSGSSTFGSSYGQFSEATDSASSQGFITGIISDYTNTATRKSCLTDYNINNETTNSSAYWGKGVTLYNQTSAITSLTFFNGGSANFTSGTILLYGVN